MDQHAKYVGQSHLVQKLLSEHMLYLNN